MKINENSVFESMRIILPEHRSATAAYRKHRDKQERPELHEQRLDDLNQKLNDVLSSDEPCDVQLKVFTSQGNCVLRGRIVSISNQQLSIVTRSGRINVDLSDVLDIV